MFGKNYNITWFDNKGRFSLSNKLDLILYRLLEGITKSSSIQLYILNKICSIIFVFISLLSTRSTQRRWRMKTKWLSVGQSELGLGSKKVELNLKRDELTPCTQAMSCVIIVAPLPQAAASKKKLFQFQNRR